MRARAQVLFGATPLQRHLRATALVSAVLSLSVPVLAQPVPTTSEPAAQEAPPAAPPKDTPLDSWDESGNERGKKAEEDRAPGLPAGGAAGFQPKLHTDLRRTRKTTIDQQQRALRRARAAPKEDDFGQKFLVGAAVAYRALPADLDVGTVDFGSPPAAESGAGAVFRLGFNPGSAFSIQAEAVWQPTRFAGIEGDATYWGFRGVMLLYLPLGRVRPFVLACGGAEWLSNDVGPIKSDIDLSVGAGAGVQVELSRWIGVRADGRVVGTDGATGMARIVEFSLGVEFRFMPTTD